MDYLATLDQLGSSDPLNVLEDANVFGSKSISKKDFMKYFAILLRTEKNKKYIKHLSFYLANSVQSRGISIATFRRNVLSSITSVKILKI